MSNKTTGALGSIIGIIIIIGVLGAIQANVPAETIEIEHDIYKATLPFGVFTAKGSIDGSWFFIAGSFEGEIGGGEIYSIKYLENNQLKTVILDAQEIPLKITGRLKLIEHRNETVKASILDVFYTVIGIMEKADIYDRERSLGEIWFTIEIPELPVVDPLTEDWIN